MLRAAPLSWSWLKNLFYLVLHYLCKAVLEGCVVEPQVPGVLAAVCLEPGTAL